MFGFGQSQNNIMSKVSMVFGLLNSNSPAQAVQILLNNGQINQGQAQLLMSAINNGNGQQVVQEMLNNGQMTQEQFNQISMFANMFPNFYNK